MRIGTTILVLSEGIRFRRDKQNEIGHYESGAYLDQKTDPFLRAAFAREPYGT